MTRGNADRNVKSTALVDRFHETNRIGRMELKPTDLILRRREAPSRRMAAGTISLVAVLRDARKSALLRTRLMADIDMIRTTETLY